MTDQAIRSMPETPAVQDARKGQQTSPVPFDLSGLVNDLNKLPRPSDSTVQGKLGGLEIQVDSTAPAKQPEASGKMEPAKPSQREIQIKVEKEEPVESVDNLVSLLSKKEGVTAQSVDKLAAAVRNARRNNGGFGERDLITAINEQLRPCSLHLQTAKAESTDKNVRCYDLIDTRDDYKDVVYQYLNLSMDPKKSSPVVASPWTLGDMISSSRGVLNEQDMQKLAGAWLSLHQVRDNMAGRYLETNINQAIRPSPYSVEFRKTDEKVQVQLKKDEEVVQRFSFAGK